MKRLIIGITSTVLALAGIGGGAYLHGAPAANASGHPSDSVVAALADGLEQGTASYAAENGTTSEEVYRALAAGTTPRRVKVCDQECERAFMTKQRNELARQAARKRLADKKAAEEAAASKKAEEQADAARKAEGEKARQTAASQQQPQTSVPTPQPAQQAAPIPQQAAPAPSGPVDHRTVRDCYVNGTNTSDCQWAIDAGGLVWVQSNIVNPDAAPLYDLPNGNLQWWFMGHNSTESWILDVNEGDIVRVNGQDYRAGTPVRVNQGQSYPAAQFKELYYLQTCYFDNATMKIVPLYKI